MSRRMLVYLPAFVLLALAVAAPGTAVAQKKLKNPRLHAALHELYEARQDLRKAKDDNHGHREKAVLAIDDAIFSLQTMLKVRGDNVVGLDRDKDFYKRHKDHPRIRQALEDLRDARSELEDAKGDFGNLKERALRDIDVATTQLRQLLKDTK